MMEINCRAYGKLNLTLDVLDKRKDGFHNVQMILQTVDLYDEVTVAIDNGGIWECVCDDPSVPDGEENLAMRAARAFINVTGKKPEGVSIRIKKRIPSQAGMGGGSADAAATLHALNTLYDHCMPFQALSNVGATVGSDVPFCLLGGTALAEGRGERLTSLPPAPEFAYLLLKPSFSVSTPELYARLDAKPSDKRPDTDGMIECLIGGDVEGIAKRLCNVFQPVLNEEYPVDELCGRLMDAGALGASLTGTGSVVFGMFRDTAAANAAASAFADGDIQTVIVQNA